MVSALWSTPALRFCRPPRWLRGLAHASRANVAHFHCQVGGDVVRRRGFVPSRLWKTWAVRMWFSPPTCSHPAHVSNEVRWRAVATTPQVQMEWARQMPPVRPATLFLAFLGPPILTLLSRPCAQLLLAGVSTRQARNAMGVPQRCLLSTGERARDHINPHPHTSLTPPLQLAGASPTHLLHTCRGCVCCTGCGGALREWGRGAPR